MKRFVRKKEDVPYVRRPALSEIVKAIEDAWEDVPDTTIRIDKHGGIQVIRKSVKDDRSNNTEICSYKAEPKLCFENGTFFWITEAWEAKAKEKSRVQIGRTEPYPLATCSIPHMGIFTGHAVDIAELEIIVEELRQAKLKVEAMLATEAKEPK
jgi:hypothetical protein